MHSARSSAADGGEEGGAKRTWTCHHCTFINDKPFAKQCAICGTKRKKEPKAAKSAAAKRKATGGGSAAKRRAGSPSGPEEADSS